MILDVGCGNHPRGDINLDLVLESSKIIRGRRVRTKPDFLGDIHSLPSRDNSFEEVICFHVLEHTNNFLKALLELIRVSKDRIHIKVPHRFSIHAKTPYHRNYFSKGYIDTVLKLLWKKG